MRWLLIVLLLCPLAAGAQVVRENPLGRLPPRGAGVFAFPGAPRGAGVFACLGAGGAELFSRPQKRPARKAAPARPKAGTAAPVSWPIESLAIEGNREYSREQILAVAGLKVGQTVTPAEFENARKRLLDSGVFESVGFQFGPGPGGKGYAVSFQVTEAGPLFPVRFEDLPATPPELEAALKASDPFFGPKIPATQPILDRYAKVVEGFLAGRNRKEAVIGKVSPDEAGQLAVVFRPAAAPPAISRVSFTGNQVIPRSTLENAINGVAIGVPYNESRLRQLLDTSVRPLYEARGRVRVAFPEIRTEKDKDTAGLAVTVKMDEGASYSLGKVQVDGTGLPSGELLKLAGFQTGDLFNSEQVQAGIERIYKRMRREGYMQVSSRVARRIDDQARTVDLALQVDRGPQYRFAKLNIEGLDIIAEPAVRKMWALKEGQPFNADYPDYFLARIREDGVFDNLGDTKATLNTNDEARTVDVTLIFRGRPPKPKPTSP